MTPQAKCIQSLLLLCLMVFGLGVQASVQGTSYSDDRTQNSRTVEVKCLLNPIAVCCYAHELSTSRYDVLPQWEIMPGVRCAGCTPCFIDNHSGTNFLLFYYDGFSASVQRAVFEWNSLFQLSLPIAPNSAAPAARTRLVYSIRDVDDNVIYVGRASGKGTPQQVLSKRISNHDHAGAGRFQIEETQGSYAANRGAEDVIYQRELLKSQSEGRTLLNIDQPIGPRNPHGRDYIDAYHKEW